MTLYINPNTAKIVCILNKLQIILNTKPLDANALNEEAIKLKQFLPWSTAKYLADENEPSTIDHAIEIYVSAAIADIKFVVRKSITENNIDRLLLMYIIVTVRNITGVDIGNYIPVWDESLLSSSPYPNQDNALRQAKLDTPVVYDDYWLHTHLAHFETVVDVEWEAIAPIVKYVLCNSTKDITEPNAYANARLLILMNGVLLHDNTWGILKETYKDPKVRTIRRMLRLVRRAGIWNIPELLTRLLSN